MMDSSPVTLATSTAGRIATRALAILVAVTLAACGGGGDGAPNFIGGGGGGGGGIGGGWTPNVFPPAASFQAQCAAPRSGADPDGTSWPDVQGTVTDENNFLRSYSNATYLWYDEITDRDPALYNDPLDYFALLRTTELTPSGNPKDQFHFTRNTDEYLALSESGVSAGYGAQFAVLQPAPPRRILVAFTDPNTPATDNGLQRGAELLTVDGVDVVNDNTSAGVDVLNAGLFPATIGESHNFEVRDPDGSVRTFTMQSAEIVSTPVQNVSVQTTPTGNVGYMLFNDHIATSETLLVDAVNQLAAAGIVDLVLDLRYNGGGFLAIAAQLAHMIAGPAQTGGAYFEVQQFNDKYPSTNPVTGQAIQPVPFYNTTLGFSTSAGTPLPSLDLQRVFVLTGGGTCSASEAIINGLRGINIEVIQIGSTTCGKPYGFYPVDNCGTTYFTIQFRGVNFVDFGDYADGFSPSPSGSNTGSTVRGCPVGDDYSRALGDPTEARFAAALQFRESGTCPAPLSSSSPETARLRLDADQPIIVPKDPWRENRIMTLP